MSEKYSPIVSTLSLATFGAASGAGAAIIFGRSSATVGALEAEDGGGGALLTVGRLGFVLGSGATFAQKPLQQERLISF
jgi:hypothetical protein